MNNHVSIYIIFFVFSFGQVFAQANGVAIQGKVTNPHPSSFLKISSYLPEGRKISKEIKIGNDGRFQETLSVSPNGSYYDAQLGGFYFSIYLKKGYVLNLSIDADSPRATLSFEGTGAAPNNYLAEASKYVNADEMYVRAKDWHNLEKEAFDRAVDSVFHMPLKLLDSYPALEGAFVSERKQHLEGFKNQIKSQYIPSYEEYRKKSTPSTALVRGQKNPEFSPFIDYAGGTAFLRDLRGKYVYIDLWATWCKPCVEEIPYLEVLEKEYHDNQKIAFVSISCDTDESRWRNMVRTKSLSGLQWRKNSEDFNRFYELQGIPRFILIDPEGKIVDAYAPSPSQKRILKELFNSLNI